MLKESQAVIKATEKLGLPVVLTLVFAAAGLFGTAWFVRWTMMENAQREAVFLRVIENNQTIVGEQVRTFNANQVLMTALLAKHDERSKEFLENDGPRRERLVVALNDLTRLLAEMRSEIKDRLRRGGG